MCFFAHLAFSGGVLLPMFMKKRLLETELIKNAFSNSNNVNYFLSIQNYSEVIEKLRRSGFSSIFFDFSALYKSLSHDLIIAKVLSLDNWCLNRESQSNSVPQTKLVLATRNMTRTNVGLSLCYVKLLLSYMCNLKAWCIVYQQIVGIPMSTNCATLIADLFSYCYERDFMSQLHKSKRYDLMDMFNDTSR